jgi:hypothetical protein
LVFDFMWDMRVVAAWVSCIVLLWQIEYWSDVNILGPTAAGEMHNLESFVSDMWLMNNNHIVEQYYLPGYDTQRGNVYEFYVLSSLGSSIYITSEDPFLLRYNDTNDSKFCYPWSLWVLIS